MIYSLLRSLLFTMPPEQAHHFSMKWLQRTYKTPIGKNCLENNFCFHHSSLQKNVFGLNFKNPVGLGAGFDKNAIYLNEINSLGFGFTEIGTVTPITQQGNDQPRLFRLPKDKALINRMGFNNDGVKVINKRLNVWRNKNTDASNFIVGANIGKNKITPNDEAWKDYTICFEQLSDVADYFTVNVSSPNTPALRELQQKDSLKKIFSELENINQSKKKRKPVILKIAPDLSQQQLDEIIELALEIKLDGLIATNTTIERNNLITDKKIIEKIGAGGLSGKPLKEKSTDVLKHLSQQLNNQIPLIASGGIFTQKDAIEKLDAGAALLQVWTGFIYQGPGIAKNICKSLIKE